MGMRVSRRQAEKGSAPPRASTVILAYIRRLKSILILGGSKF